MMIEETEVVNTINQQLSLVSTKTARQHEAFTNEEAQACVSQLCEQNKVMNSDGFFYGI